MTPAEKERRKQLLREQEAIRDRKVAKTRSPFQELEHQFSSQAEQLLEKPHLLPELADMYRLKTELRLWACPAFDPFKSWLVYRRLREKNTRFLCEVTWDRPADMERIYALIEKGVPLADSTPSIQIRSTVLASKEFDKKFDELREISLPVFIKNNMIGLDGETCGISTGDGFLNAQLSWWCDGPPEWSELTDWFHNMKNYFEEQLEKNQSQA